MENEFIPYEQALVLKELGFDKENCFARWSTYADGEGYLDTSSKSAFQGRDDMSRQCLAPLYQQSFRWFREKYDLFGIVEGKGYDHKKYYIYSINGKWHPLQPGFDKPEEAELECLKKLIEIVKNNI